MVSEDELEVCFCSSIGCRAANLIYGDIESERRAVLEETRN